MHKYFSVMLSLTVCAHVNGLLIRTDSQQEAGSITDKLEQVLQGVLYSKNTPIFNVYCICSVCAHVRACVCVCVCTYVRVCVQINMTIVLYICYM